MLAMSLLIGYYIHVGQIKQRGIKMRKYTTAIGIIEANNDVEAANIIAKRLGITEPKLSECWGGFSHFASKVNEFPNCDEIAINENNVHLSFVSYRGYSEIEKYVSFSLRGF